MKLFHLIDSVPVFQKMVRLSIENRNKEILAKILPFINSKKQRILDIGSGTGHTAKSLMEHGHKVICADVENMSVFEETNPIIIDGERLPFKNKEFDVALLITVLHHTKDPRSVIKETKRVSKRIIVMEDTYNNSLQKYLTFVMDSIGNMQFTGHPHSNKTDTQWREVFDELDLKVEKVKKNKFLTFFESTTYLLTPKNN